MTLLGELIDSDEWSLSVLLGHALPGYPVSRVESRTRDEIVRVMAARVEAKRCRDGAEWALEQLRRSPPLERRFHVQTAGSREAESVSVYQREQAARERRCADAREVAQRWVRNRR